MSLWAWASAVWASPGVERACLNLQDRAGQSVVLLLWGVWRATGGQQIEPALADRAVALVRPIETDILRPMRGVRRALALNQLGLDDLDQREACAQVRGVELNLERALLGALELQTSEQSSDAKAGAAQVVLMLMEIWNGGSLDEGDRVLAAALMEALA